MAQSILGWIFTHKSLQVAMRRHFERSVMESYVTTSKKRLIVAAILITEVLDDFGKKRRGRGKTRSWIRRRRERGYFNNIVKELLVEDTAGYREMMRMSFEDFKTILKEIEPFITPHQVAGGHGVINAAERLTLTIRFLASGETYRSLSFQFRISVAAISYIVLEVCKAIAKHLGKEYLKFPSTADEWLEIASKFEERWNFPNCVGAVDGKHIVMQPPANAGSHYYNYKHTNSIVLMAVAGPDYECIYADVGTNGRVSDGGVWNKCGLAQAIDEGTVSLPPPKCLPLGIIKLPHVFVGDDAFALKTHMMKPYPQNGLTDDKRIYNYRHSRARRLSENLFGILANRWRVFTVLLLPPNTVEYLVLATLVLHYYLRHSQSRSIYCPFGMLDTETDEGEVVHGQWRNDAPSRESFLSLTVPSTGHNAPKNAKEIRELFKEYFLNEGAVEWQWNVV